MYFPEIYRIETNRLVGFVWMRIFLTYEKVENKIEKTVLQYNWSLKINQKHMN